MNGPQNTEAPADPEREPEEKKASAVSVPQVSVAGEQPPIPESGTAAGERLVVVEQGTEEFVSPIPGSSEAPVDPSPEPDLETAKASPESHGERVEEQRNPISPIVEEAKETVAREQPAAAETGSQEEEVELESTEKPVGLSLADDTDINLPMDLSKARVVDLEDLELGKSEPSTSPVRVDHVVEGFSAPALEPPMPSPEPTTEAEDERPVVPGPRRERLDEGRGSVKVELTEGYGDLISAKSWESLNLKPELLRGIYAKGFTRPAKIQAVALPMAIEGSTNLIAQAKNGSGKTACFALAAISKVDDTISEVQALLMAPTRELAKQNEDVIKDLGRYTNIKTFLASPPATQVPLGIHIVSGTPGKVRDLITRRALPVDKLKCFVLDEADVMVDQDQSMGQQVMEIVRRVPKSAQVLLFSATFPPRVRQLAMAACPKANKLTMAVEELTLSTTRQYYMTLEPGTLEQKMETLFGLYEAMTVGQSVIFVERRDAAAAVAQRMKDKGFSVGLIMGDGPRGGQVLADAMTHEKRQRRMQEFRDGVTRTLVTTNLLARGIDVPAVTLVINFDLPQSYTERGQVEPETYLHRVGRTGRFGKRGIAINFVCSHQDLEYIHDIENYYKCEISPLEPDFEHIADMMSNLSIS